ncbi:sugar transferase [Tenacibaculum retecalamus]|uniref:sugar transferase n=1 Tax=Tenacibaculum retecalamus TaxID=3018315 RepID=UPI0023D926AE|nr:sugar transferase [Tenacibaculum retecalamus]WBX71668.1 sugar transferase [Tenacibaculum retecalamus]
MTDNSISLLKRKNNVILKRSFDIFIVSIILLPSLLLIILAFLLTKLTLKESAIFSQIRVGKNDKLFLIYKIRTISNIQNECLEKSNFKISTLGKFLRLSKIDELPQLFNVLKGDMSFIGSRPEQPNYVDEYLKQNPSFNLRHIVKPGITGWAQVNLPKAKPKDNLDKLKFDLYYINEYSWKLDFIILIKTIKIVLTLNSN